MKSLLTIGFTSLFSSFYSSAQQSISFVELPSFFEKIVESEIEHDQDSVITKQQRVFLVLRPWYCTTGEEAAYQSIDSLYSELIIGCPSPSDFGAFLTIYLSRNTPIVVGKIDGIDVFIANEVGGMKFKEIDKIDLQLDLSELPSKDVYDEVIHYWVWNPGKIVRVCFERIN